MKLFLKDASSHTVLNMTTLIIRCEIKPCVAKNNKEVEKNISVDCNH